MFYTLGLFLTVSVSMWLFRRKKVSDRVMFLYHASELNAHQIAKHLGISPERVMNTVLRHSN